MPSVCFYFQVHQPLRIKRFRVFDVGTDSGYFDDAGESNVNNRRILEKVANKCYLPANRLLHELLLRHPGFRVSFSFSGIFLEQIEHGFPEVLESFQRLVATGQVEVLGETSHHSLAILYSPDEFRHQVMEHRRRVGRLFGVEPRVFRNTELIYDNRVAAAAEEMGFTGILAEGVDRILGWRSPNFVYRPMGTSKLALLLKNYRLSDDIAFRFSERSWKEYPLTAAKFARWISEHNGNGQIVNLFMDYETFGEHQWDDTGIFNFLRHLPSELFRRSDNDFVTPSEAIRRYTPMAELDFPDPVSWADEERDLSAWRSNDMQRVALDRIYALEGPVLATGDRRLIEDWRRLQTSDHFYYMCTKWFADGDVHKYFSPYESPYEAFINFMNALNDVIVRIRDHPSARNRRRVAVGRNKQR